MKVLVTGGTGMLGHEIKMLRPNFCFPNREELDLESLSCVQNFLRNNSFDVAIHLAARVGGVADNSAHVADFFYKNSLINSNFLECCREAKVKKVVSTLSTCVYPDTSYVKYPLTEDQLHCGPPHSSNFGYAYAKRMLDVQSRAYREQYGCNFVTVIPNNMYGPNDNYNLESSHVVPALIRKFHEAMLNNRSEVFVWGTGSPLREFTFSRDAANIILWILENYDGDSPVNIGNTDQISIKELSLIIADVIGFTGSVVFDSSKPDGQYKKPSSNEKLRSLGWRGEYTNLHEGLRETVKYFVDNYPHVRGIHSDL